jgi:hypothetical protein
MGCARYAPLSPSWRLLAQSGHGGEYVIEVIVDLDGKLENLPIELRVSVIFFEYRGTLNELCENTGQSSVGGY